MVTPCFSYIIRPFLPRLELIFNPSGHSCFYICVKNYISLIIHAYTGHLYCRRCDFCIAFSTPWDPLKHDMNQSVHSLQVHLLISTQNTSVYTLTASIFLPHSSLKRWVKAYTWFILRKMCHLRTAAVQFLFFPVPCGYNCPPIWTISYPRGSETWTWINSLPVKISPTK